MIREQKELSNYDKEVVELFRRFISFKDEKYYVQLPWDFDKISCGPSKHPMALRVLDGVEPGLERDLIYRDYLVVFSGLRSIFGFCKGLS